MKQRYDIQTGLFSRMSTYLRPQTSEDMAVVLAGYGGTSREQLVLLFEVVAELNENGRDQIGSAGHIQDPDWATEAGSMLIVLATQAGLADTDAFVASWQLLIRGMLIGLRSGDRAVVSSARRAAEVALLDWPRR